MNIGLFTDAYYPEINGVANSVFLLKSELEKRGHQVFVFTTSSPEAPEHEHNVFRVPSIPFIFLTQLRVGLFYYPKLAQVIGKLNLDIIHTHTEFSLGIFGRIMAKELKLPVVHTYHTTYEACTHYITHGRIFDSRIKKFARKFSGYSCNASDQVIAPSQKTKELLREYNVIKEISVIPTGVDIDKFRPEHFTDRTVQELKNKYGILPQDKVILYLGRISKEKNIEEIIEAMPGYMKKRSNVKFAVVGGGPALGGLKSLVKKLDLEDRFVFAGEQPWDIIGLYYQLGDVFVNASVCETQGLTYLEAFASGLPVVAREDKCLKDILEEGKNGYCYTDWEGLYRGLDQVLFDDGKTDYAKNAVNMAMKYSSGNFAYQMEEIYQRVASESRVFCISASCEKRGI